MKFLPALLLAAVVALSSCGDARKLAYLQGPLDASKYSTVTYKQPVILPGDILDITVFSANADASAVYNQPAIMNTSSAASTPGLKGGANVGGPIVAGYLVDSAGTIQFQRLGNIYVKGLTRDQLGAKISDMLKDTLKNVYTKVRFTNFKITMIGEVNQPSVYAVPSEKVSILEAVGLAGDLTVYGRRDSVMIIRETDTERKIGWVDIRRTDIFNSEYFYLHQNDVVVVHPIKRKPTATDQNAYRNIALAATIVSTLAVVYSLVFQ